jgi:fused signal recognition particle receptor
MGLFDRLKQGLARTAGALGGAVARVLAPGRSLDAASREELEQALLEADLGVEAATALLSDLKRVDGIDPREALAQAALRYLSAYLPPAPDLLALQPLHLPEVTLFVGVNGAGKTTTCGKLAARWASQGSRVLLAAGDTFRAGARAQLEAWAGRAGVEVFTAAEGVDPAALAYDAVQRALSAGYQRLLIDTAGRLQTRTGLMEELKKVHRVCGKALAGAPHRVVLVLDGSNGQNMVSQARLFSQALKVDGLIITKLDGSARAGALLPLSRELRLPVLMLGVGEGLDDLQPFKAEDYCRALAGAA